MFPFTRFFSAGIFFGWGYRHKNNAKRFLRWWGNVAEVWINQVVNEGYGYFREADEKSME